MLVTKTIEIDMGHRVPNHKSKCRNFHGHRYKIVVGVDDKVITTPGSSDEGMLIDFGDLKQIMMEVIHDKFDHSFCMWEGDIFRDVCNEWKIHHNQRFIFVDFIPTAENLAKYWFGLLEEKLKAKKIKIKFIKVWETPTSMAMYEVD